MTIEELEKALKSGRPPIVLDVRSSVEFNSGHIQGAVHAPLVNVLKRAQTVCNDKDHLLIIVCEHGPRAQLARLMLKLNGYKKLELLDGHMSRWRQSGRNVQKIR